MTLATVGTDAGGDSRNLRNSILHEARLITREGTGVFHGFGDPGDGASLADSLLKGSWGYFPIYYQETI